MQNEYNAPNQMINKSFSLPKLPEEVQIKHRNEIHVSNDWAHLLLKRLFKIAEEAKK